MCNDNWDFLDAMVACRQLGFPSAQDTLDVSPGEGLIWMDDLTCTGKEQRLEVAQSKIVFTSFDNQFM